MHCKEELRAEPPCASPLQQAKEETHGEFPAVSWPLQAKEEPYDEECDLSGAAADDANNEHTTTPANDTDSTTQPTVVDNTTQTEPLYNETYESASQQHPEGVHGVRLAMTDIPRGVNWPALILHLYATWAPARLAKVDDILSKYSGVLPHLAVHLSIKYANTPFLPAHIINRFIRTPGDDSDMD